MSIDFEAISVTVLPRAESVCQELLPAGQRRGHEFVAGNLKGDAGDSLSVNLNTGMWKDFATGEAGGDLISLVAAAKGMNQREAAEYLVGDLSQYTTGEAKASRKAETLKPILPAPEEIKNQAMFRHPKFGDPAKVYIYRDAVGRVLNYIMRYELKDGSKQFSALTYGTLGSNTKWHWKQIPDKRPLYGLETIKEPKKAAILVEGEKVAEALRPLFPKTPIITWPGGAQAVNKVDWKPLHGFERLILWPDNDGPGRKCMNEIAGKLHGKAKDLKLVDVESLGEKEDAADLVQKGMSAQRIHAFVKEHMHDWRPEEDEPPVQETTQQGDGLEPGKRYHVTLLGYDDEAFYYFPSESRTVVSLSAQAHTSNNLMRLAPKEWWEARFKTKFGVDWQNASNWLMRHCYKKGFYNSNLVRGRGAWWDDGRVVMHLGDVLLVDCVPVLLEDFRTRFVYPARPRIEFDICEPLSAAECKTFLDVCKMMRWDNELFAYLLAGWCITGPICGALRWRPHIWITGAAGSGKSWIMEQLIQRMLGGFAINVIDRTTEAGVRQLLRLDAMPVIFDETKGEDKREQERIQAILGLMRQASSESTAHIVKGSSSGIAKHFNIRSAFALSSVGLGIKQHADETRISVLALRTPPRGDQVATNREKRRFAEIVSLATQMTPDYVRRLIMRSIRLIPTIRKNAEIFGAAATNVLGTQRAGDQVGILLAGAYSITSSKEITMEAAEQWIAVRDIRSSVADGEPDDMRCLGHLMQHVIKLQNGKGNIERTIGELVEILLGLNPFKGVEEVSLSLAEETLARRGIKVDRTLNAVVVANSHRGLEEIFRESPWPRNWDRTLKQSAYADNYNNEPLRFPGQAVSKVTRIRLNAQASNQSSSSSFDDSGGAVTGDFSAADIPF